MPEAAVIAFRCDAATHIGSGHVMRCLTLADELRDRGALCHFLCRDLPGHMAGYIGTRGYGVDLLPCGPQDRRESWLGVDWQLDARQSGDVLARVSPDWLVIDHYALDAGWERAVAPVAPRRMVIDDLADRSHAAQLLLDPMPGHGVAHHGAWIDGPCDLLLGPDHALLAPVYARERAASLGRGRTLSRLMIAMGGYDPANVTGAILTHLAASGIALDGIDVVLGAQAPHVDAVREMAQAMPWPVAVHAGTPRMAELLRGCDLVIGAGGTSAWERCCLGVPCLMLTLAENQTEVVASLVAAGAALAVGAPDAADFTLRLDAALAACAAPDRLAAMSAAAAAVVDGRGTARVADAMLARLLTVRLAGPPDCDAIWHWRQAGDAARYYTSGQVEPLADHRAWYGAALSDPARMLLIVERDKIPLGHVRLDRLEGGAARVSLCLAPEARGRGLAGSLLRAAETAGLDAGLRDFVAMVHRDNAASQRLFRRAGCRLTGTLAGFDTFEIRRLRTGE